MRRRMTSENAFDAAVFIGGMRGIFDEYRMFVQLAPKALVLPIMSTGVPPLGFELNASKDFINEQEYVELLYQKLVIDLNQPRTRLRKRQ